ncbi:MAG TPA: HAD family hydrolase [Candidatus Acidoferrum sp.]|nr:HAD family hydrolase [Candidatus Acidoferrum sp.]
MTIRAVIFDLDGTLTSFNLNYRTVRAEVKSFLVSSGLPASILSVNESVFEMLKRVKIYMRNTGKSEKSFCELRAKALATVEQYELEAAKSTSLLPGVLEVLKTLKGMGLKIGLCTINSEKSVCYILKRFKITGFFDAITPRDSIRNVKPSSEHLEATLHALNANPEETIVAGDGTTDMKCASALGAVAVGLPIGVSTSKELEDSGANYLITAITDLPALIQQINSFQQ